LRVVPELAKDEIVNQLFHGELAINLRGHHVERGDQGDQVGDHQSLRKLLDDSHGQKRSGARAHPIGALAAVGYNVVSHFTAGGLDAALRLADLRLDLPRALGHELPAGELFQRLADDTHRLATLQYAAIEPVIAVAYLPAAISARVRPSNGDLELEIGVSAVRVRLAEIKFEPRRAQIWPHQAIVDRHLQGDHRHPGESLHEDFV